MGRNAKLRKQRKYGETAGPSSIKSKSSATVKRSIRIELPAVVETDVAPEPQKKLPGFLDKLWSRFKPSANEDYTVGIEANQFWQDREAVLGAIAWEGYQANGRGFVLAFAMGEPTIAVEYVPRKFLKQYVEKSDMEIFSDLLETYDPKEAFASAYLHHSGETIVSCRVNLDFSPPEYYHQRQQAQAQAG